MVKSKTARIDTTALQALPIAVAEHEKVRIVQVGCGGTGSHLARMTAAVAAALRDRSEVELVFCDPDIVEPKNVPRQLFATSDVGRPKAAVLAERYSAAWGLEVGVDHRPFSCDEYDGWRSRDTLTVIVGAVDNAAARKAIAKALSVNKRTQFGDQYPRLWWLDAGNAADSGQVLLGSNTVPKDLEGAVQLGAVWRLPAPSLVAPDLLKARPEEKAAARLSCAELVAANLQSQAVNAWAATIAGDMLYRLLVTRDLARFATYFDARTGTVRSTPTAPAEIARAAGITEKDL